MPGLYEMKATITRYIMYLRKGSGKTDLNDERALLTRAKREAADMDPQLPAPSRRQRQPVRHGFTGV